MFRYTAPPQQAADATVLLAQRRFQVTDADLGWLLVDAAACYMKYQQRHQLFVAIACGEHLSVIRCLLMAVIDARHPLSRSLLQMLHRWLDGYRGAPEEPPMRLLIREAELITATNDDVPHTGDTVIAGADVAVCPTTQRTAAPRWHPRFWLNRAPVLTSRGSATGITRATGAVRP